MVNTMRPRRKGHTGQRDTLIYGCITKPLGRAVGQVGAVGLPRTGRRPTAHLLQSTVCRPLSGVQRTGPALTEQVKRKAVHGVSSIAASLVHRVQLKPGSTCLSRVYHWHKEGGSRIQCTIACAPQLTMSSHMWQATSQAPLWLPLSTSGSAMT